MTELDFDELDKAVGDLMKDVESSGVIDREDEGSGSITTTAKPSEKNPTVIPDKLSFDNDKGPTKNTEKFTRREVKGDAVASLASKRRGKFMDVVRSSTPLTDTAKPVKRHGVALKPLSDAPSDEKNKKPTTGESPQSAKPFTTHDEVRKNIIKDTSYLTMASYDAEHEAVPEDLDDSPDAFETKLTKLSRLQPTKAEKTSTDTMPDEVEVAEYNPGTLTESEPKQNPSETPDSLEATNELEVEKPLTSPFLTGARVEKRPLGNSPSVSAEEDEGYGEGVELRKPSTPDTPGLPEELSSEIMRIESSEANTSSQLPSEPEGSPVEAAPSVDELEKSDIPKEAADDDSPEVGQLKPVDTPAGGSIATQYKEKPSKIIDEQENVAIYDTASYHQPLAHPAKKKSGLAVILWVLLIAIIGVGIGIAAFYFTITRA